MKQPEALVLLLCMLMIMVGVGVAKSHQWNSDPTAPAVSRLQ